MWQLLSGRHEGGHTETDEELFARELPVPVDVELRKHGVELRAVEAEQRRETVETAPLHEAAAVRVAEGEQLVAARLRRTHLRASLWILRLATGRATGGQ